MAIIGGLIILVLGITMTSSIPDLPVMIILTISFGIVSIVGGSLLFLDQSLGGYLAVIGGGGCILAFAIFFQEGLAIIGFGLEILVFLIFYLNPILVLIGGVLGLISSSKE